MSSILSVQTGKFAYMTIGERIRKYRRARGWSQQRLADEMKRYYATVSRAAVAQWESGETKGLRPENLIAVAYALEATPEEITHGSAFPYRRSVPAAGEGSSAEALGADRQMLVDAVTAAVTTAASQRLSLTPAQMGEYAALIYEMWSDAPNKAARVRPERLLRLVSSR